MKTVKQSSKKSWMVLILKGKSRMSVLLNLTSTFYALCNDTARYLDQTPFTFSNMKKPNPVAYTLTTLQGKKQRFALLCKVLQYVLPNQSTMP